MGILNDPFRRKKLNIWGMPDDPSLIADGDGISNGMPVGRGMGAPPSQMENPSVNPPAQDAKPERWMNGGKFTGRDAIGLALGAIGDAFATNNGGQAITAPSLMRSLQAKQQAAQDLADYNRKRQDDNTDWQVRQQWTLDHQKPVNNDTANDLEWYKGLSPEDRTLYDQMHPVVIQTDRGPQIVPRSTIGGGTTELPPGFTIDNQPPGGAPQQGQPPFAPAIPTSTGRGGFPSVQGAPGTLTSGRRTLQGNAMVGGVPNSWHLTGDAADYTGTTPDALRSYFGDGVKIIPEKDHLHVQARGLGAPYFGRRGTYGLGY